MASSALAAVAWASALGASAVSLSQPAGPRFGQGTEEAPVAVPRPADLSSWASGPLFSRGLDSKASGFHHAEVRSLVGDYNLSVAAFDYWVDQGVSGGLLGGSGWETERISELCRLYRSNGAVGNFLDVGANIGTFTIPLADCIRSTGGRVFAVEGMPPTVDHLAAGILENKLDNVDMYNYAVGAPDDPPKVTMSLNPVNKGGSAVKGNKPFTVMGEEELQKLFHPSKKAQTYAEKVAVMEYEVPLTTGDLMLQHNPAMKAIHIAKVDIEGHEGHFIKGSQLLFSEFPPCILTIELIEDWLERAGTPAGEILDLLAGWGYKNVPTAAELKKRGTQGHTLTIHQKRMGACLNRVRSFAQA